MTVPFLPHPLLYLIKLKKWRTLSKLEYILIPYVEGGGCITPVIFDILYPPPPPCFLTAFYKGSHVCVTLRHHSREILTPPRLFLLNLTSF